jgi:hypothetical protein
VARWFCEKNQSKFAPNRFLRKWINKSFPWKSTYVDQYLGQFCNFIKLAKVNNCPRAKILPIWSPCMYDL